MADEREIQSQLDKAIAITDNRGIAQAVNDTYSYANNTYFYAMMPTFFRDYCYRYIKPACSWLDGYVPALHEAGVSGIVSTRIGNRLITGLTKQIMGEKLIFKLNDKEQTHDTLEFASKWYEESDIYKAVYSAIGFSLGCGTSLLKANVKNGNQIWWQGVRFDNCFYTASYTNEIDTATFLIRGYTDTTKDNRNNHYLLVEHRYYEVYEKPEMMKRLDGTYVCLHAKGEKKPVVEYNIHRVNGSMLNNETSANLNKSRVNWQEIPYTIREMIKKDFSVMRIDEPQDLPFEDLGVVPLLNGCIDLGVPSGSNLGESLLVGIQSEMIVYELAESYLIRDMYLGKGSVYLPKSMNLGDLSNGLPLDNNVLGGIGDKKYEFVSGVEPEKQQIVVNQFNLRGNEWQQIQDNQIRNIALKWGMSPKILSSYLANGQAQMTATQVDSEDDVAIAFIYHTRSYFKNALNKLLDTTLKYYGYEPNINMDFASPSLINKDRLLDRTLKLLGEGLIDIEEAIRTLNPDLEEEAIQRKIGIAMEQRQQMMMAQMPPEMNDDGTFGNQNLADLGGNNLNGSTYQ